MKKKIDWDNYRFRCSQLHLLATGTIGITKVQEQRIEELKKEKETGVNVNNNKIKWTPNKAKELADLEHKRDNPELPATMQTKLREIHRAETFSRNFLQINKYVVKGLLQEEEAISVYQQYRKKVQGINTFFTKNGHRLQNEWFSGEPDLSLGNDVNECEEGFDTKCSWSLSSFPFANDPLDEIYELQNQGYMSLTGAKKWTTVYVLVNVTETLLDNEKKKHYYALGAPTEGTPKHDEYIKKAKEVEKMLIFDYDRFVNINPHHLLEYNKVSWLHEGLDIPLEHRVVEKVSTYDPKKIEFLKERVKIAREYLKSLDKQK